MSETLSWTTYVDTKAQTEHDRLMLLQEVFDPFSARLLDQAGVAPGWRCLEVGAGAGSVARMLADRAGAANVTATDMSTHFLAPLAESGIRVLHHDVVADDQPGEFDVIHSRFVLEHITRRDETIRRMASWLRPGGVLIVECGTPIPELSSDPAVRQGLTALATLMARSVGTDPVWARTLPVPLEDAGLVECTAEGHIIPVRGGGALARWLTATHRLIEEPALASGVVSQEELADAYARYADPAFVDYTWLTIGAFGRRPAL
ncbi:MAG: methyltransferase domain-containing protein [Actinophytocola sp.]|uniref:class I SAM-dependent methyltransferase n=1 Tax=Actinophytocola sp. TaxID=1872138 RepID=UPI0013241ADC|nr:class I SAM-dependent methyltransferase [Actinophytocola sp.]MPZ81311.1 methyltransferase domain-containing protein [Actinophytocola sp.]